MFTKSMLISVEKNIPIAKLASNVPTTFHFLNIKPPRRNMIAYCTVFAIIIHSPFAGMMMSVVRSRSLILNDIRAPPQLLSNRHTRPSLRR